jgi:methylaspartate mutase sigma subunit
MNEKQQNRAIIVTGVIGEDVHITGIRILEHALRHEGFTVYSLGIHNSQQNFIEEAIKVKADAVLISSLTGHGEILLEGFKDNCQKSGLKDVLFYIGPNSSYFYS